MPRENITIKLASGQTAQVMEIRSGDASVGEYYGGTWDGYEVRLLNTGGQVLHTAQLKTWGYPILASVHISPDGKAFAVMAEGNDGFEQEDHTVGVYEISNVGKLKTLYQEQRQSGRIVIESPQISWIQDQQIIVKWIVTGTSVPREPDSITIDRTNLTEAS
jgi:hypothetical protein